MQEDIISLVSRPSRYIGGEINSVKKDLARIETKIVLIFPDLYEIGISHLGLKILYQILNNREDVAAERAYAPWTDYQEILIKEDSPLVSIESALPIKEFDIIGFTLPYELTFTNILKILDLSEIPLYADDRDREYPLIIGGGSSVFNPEPLADFLDAFVLGDGEEVIIEIVDTYQEWKRERGSKEELLRLLARIEGVYVPSLYSPPTTRVHHRIKRRIIDDLNNIPYADRPVLPYAKAIHDRFVMEISRGCTHGCRFCQAGMVYRPVRDRSPEKIEEIIEDGLKVTGYEEVSLSSLSTGDYPCLSLLLTRLMDRYEGDRVSFSLPSLRVGRLETQVLREITRVKRAGFTLAPEAGSDRLRRVINKEISEEELERIVDNIIREGWRSVKFYFMIGLPTEEDKDLQGIIDLCKRVNRRHVRLKVSISTFVPKAHTPFQWVGQISIEEIKRRQRFIKEELKGSRIEIDIHRPEVSLIEAVLSRGDRRLGELLMQAVENGCRFDGWTELFSFEIWNHAFEKTGIDSSFYACRDIDVKEVLPWDHLDTGVSKEFLIGELSNAYSTITTSDCRWGGCHNCGVCIKIGSRRQGAQSTDQKSEVRGQEITSKRPGRVTQKIEYRYRIRFAKQNRLSLLSHLELVSTISRSLRRTKLPLSFSTGFNPHIKLSFGPALSLGIESISEYMDIAISRPIEPENIKEEINRQLPDGLYIMEIKRIPHHANSLNNIISGYAYEIGFRNGISGDQRERFSDIVRHFLMRDRVVIKRTTDRGEKRVDVRPFIEKMEIIDREGEGKDHYNRIFLFLKNHNNIVCRPQDVLQGFLNSIIKHGRIILGGKDIKITRTGMYIDTDGAWHSPME